MRNSTFSKLGNGISALMAVPSLLAERQRSTRFLFQVYGMYRAESLYARNCKSIPTIQPTDLFPRLFDTQVRLVDAALRPGSTTCYEAYLLASLVRFLRPRILFEFGTFEGRTTLQLAMNSPEDAVVYTIDLPHNDSATRYTRAYPDEGDHRRLPVGARFQAHPESRKIKQIFGDSGTAVDTNLRGNCDFIFVDGDHSYDYVKVDSENALSMLGSDGVILWHDYAGSWRDVGHYLRQIASHKKLYHLQGTSLVIYGPTLCSPEATNS